MDVSLHPVAGFETEFHIARSECIDAFARVELALNHLLERAGKTGAKQTFAQKLKNAKAIKAAPMRPKKTMALLSELLAECETASSTRNDIAHAVMQICKLSSDAQDQTIALFTNVKPAADQAVPPLISTLGKLTANVQTWNKLANRLNEVLRPIPELSQPQPSPAAATDP